MAKIFITGSADGLGQLSAQWLLTQGHDVVLHARNVQRSREALAKTPGASKALVADLTDMQETKQLADDVNSLGPFDAIIHNAGVYQRPGNEIFAVNTLAPYILTCLIQRPKRLIYLSSQMHMYGQGNLERITKNNNGVSYSDSKLHVLMLSIEVARRWPGVFANTVDPGWVPTKMGGRGAPDDLQKGYQTQAWLAASNDTEVQVSGKYFFHQKQRRYNSAADDLSLREKLLERCAEITGIDFPA